ncbi:NADH-Ubiquinone oxidoreductase (complex I), chain 5 N-terminus [Spirosomataceae bacterium TFI 002]|nr:NADH-Ubiquinone oxidoreductase (complex I), chain 5 N-terminus [Spirosomataceae bacterium TFI 002]
MNQVIQFFIFIPLFGFVMSLIIPEKNETLLSRLAFSTAGAQLLLTVVFIALWAYDGFPNYNLKEIELLSAKGYLFFIDFYFDKITAVYLFVGGVLVFLITLYSRYYLHREKGYKRFFNTILFFYCGYTLTVIAGNLETLFIGWEILGISSFLLIAFYRNRYLPVKNAVKVFSVYRIGDVGILLAMWMSHHLWHENITFEKLNNSEIVHEHLMNHSFIGAFIALMLLVSASAKSAQLPFSSWLPRAMEGPTPSSAIFYGSLSVHIGAFLLLRTFPLIEPQTSIRIIIGLLGLTTAIISTGIARVQSSIKSQIAYASIAQIGLIFVEIALGLENLALFHFAGNAFLRTYQLLVSPSVVTYLIREQFYMEKADNKSIESSFPTKIANTLYILCIKEWNLDSFMYRYMWNPMKWLGSKVKFLTLKHVMFFFVPAFLIGLVFLFFQELIPSDIKQVLPIVFSIMGLIMVLKAFTERQRARMSWVLVLMNHAWIALAISFNEQFNLSEIAIYLSGILVMGLVGFLAILRVKKLEGNIDLDRFHGHSYEHPKIALVFLIACLGVSGFPITPTFIGEDLIFTHIHEDQVLLAITVSLSFILDGLAIIRIFSRIFMGPHMKTYHEVAYRSS